MPEELKAELIAAVTNAADLLSEAEALTIVKVCRYATDRAYAETAEKYMMNAIGGEIQ